MVLECKDVSFGYRKNKKVLEDINFQIKEGEILSLLGPNGTGKSTLLNCINGTLLYSGQIEFHGQDIRNLSLKKKAKLVGYVPQQMKSDFNLKVIDFVMMGRIPYSRFGFKEEDRRIAFSTLKKVGLEGFELRSLNELSGGEKQKVYISRALTQEPEILILDEPTSALDLRNQLDVMELLSELSAEEKLSMIISIHDLSLASMFSDKVMMLKDCHLVATGTVDKTITEEHIREVYGVNSSVVKDTYKYIHLHRDEK